MRRLMKNFGQNQGGVAAIEFSLIALPLFLTIFAIIELSTQYFVSSALDHALHSATRQIRTGEAQGRAMDQAAFKAEVCKQMASLFNCIGKLKLKVDVMPSVAAGSRANPINASRKIEVSETFNMGKSGDFLLAQAFLPWPAFIGQFSLGQRTVDDEYVLRSITLFRNEPS